ncbi:secreted RxLR effector protein 161-like [Pistacia vera]|uniref:secreted RxLR effector protein 161-like n=1 Tax=Pistacia vera TaxID=55513 RepID=UPI001263C212|nr:secreted RxLR effector protein 161-like [Pistacia vera]
MESVPYANVVGSLMYAMISTRPDLAFAISMLSRNMSNPGMEHWTTLKWMLKYINSTVCVGHEYCKRNTALDLVGFVDADFAGDKDTRKSTTAYFFTLGGNCISWKSQSRPIVALSLIESKYIVVTDAVKEALWLKGILIKVNLIGGKVTVYSDSQSAIHLSKNPVYHERTKHVDVHYHFVRDQVASGIIELKKVPT